MRDVAGLTMLAVTAVIPVWVARAVLGMLMARLAVRSRSAAPSDAPPQV